MRSCWPLWSHRFVYDRELEPVVTFAWTPLVQCSAIAAFFVNAIFASTTRSTKFQQVPGNPE